MGGMSIIYEIGLLVISNCDLRTDQKSLKLNQIRIYRLETVVAFTVRTF